MFTKIQNFLYKSFYKIKSKFYSPRFFLFYKIFNKSNINKVIIIFIVGFISRALVCYFYGINVYIEYLNKISIIYYMYMALFIVIAGELISYFEINIIPSFVINYYDFVLNLIIKIFSTTWISLLNISEYVNIINRKIYYIRNHISFNDIKLSYIISFVRNIFNSIKYKNIFTIGIDINNDFKGNENVFNDAKSNNVKINNIVNKNMDNEEILLPKTYNPNRNGESSNSNNMNTAKVNYSNNNNDNPNRSNNRSVNTIPGSEIGFPSEILRRGEDILLTSPTNNIQNSTYSYTMKTVGDFNLYDNSYSEGSSLRTPSTMPPLFDNQESYNNSIKSDRNSVDSRSSYRPYVDSTGASNYPAPLTLKNKVVKPSDIWSGYPLVNPNKNILFTDSDTNLSIRSVTRNSESVYSRSIGLTKNVNEYHNISPIARNTEDAILSSNRILSHRPNSYNNPTSPNYISKHMKNVKYVEAKEGVLTKMKEEYAKGNLSMYDNEVVVINDRKIGKVKLLFKDLGGKFENGVRKIKSLCIKYEDIAKRKVYWNIFEVDTGNYESYAEFKKSWDSKKGLWKQIKDRVKTDLKRDIEELLGMRKNGNAIDNRPIDNLIEQKHAYERLKARNAKLRAANMTSTATQNSSTHNDLNTNLDVSQIQQEEYSHTKDKSCSKHRKHGHGHKHVHGHKHSHKQGHSHGHKHRSHNNNNSRIKE